MFSLEKCKRILGAKAEGLTDEYLESVRDQLYIAANLAFEHWRKGHCLTSGDSANTSPEVSQRLTPNPLPVGDPVGVKKQGEDKPR